LFQIFERMTTMGKRNTAELADPANESFAAAAGLSRHAAEEISDTLRRLLADVFALYFKTKNFHWHMTGPHFRDYHLLLDEQGEQILAMTDDIAERARKIGGTTLHSIGDVARHQRLKDNDEDGVPPTDMLWRSAHEICEKHDDVATASLIENWLDETERRAWFLSEAVQRE
jgi:starvation-inducible DNA-binding protein